MNKILLLLLLVFLLPILSSAQNASPVFENFAKGLKDHRNFAFNDHLNVMQLTTDDDKFNLVAVNEKMQIVWKISLDGYGIDINKFDNKIVALAATAHSRYNGINNIYRAYLVDPETGRVSSDKIVYQSTNDLVEIPVMYTGNGAFFKLAVRQTTTKRPANFGEGFISAITFADGDIRGTRAIKMIDYNEKLDSVSAFKIPLSNGSFMSMVWNKQGDTFISWLNGPSIEIYKYDAGKTSPSNQLTVPLTLKASRNADAFNLIHLQPATDRNVLYYSLLYLNADKEPELGVGKLDFEKNIKGYVTQVLNKSNLKVLKKNFVPPNKDFDDVDFGLIEGMGIKFIEEHNGKLIVATATEYVISGISYQGDLLLNCYDTNLKLGFQQILPTNYRSVYKWPPIGRYWDNSKLHIITNAKKGLSSLQGVYAILDVNNGKWDKIEHLSKKHIGDTDYIDGNDVLWFGNNYIVPYFAIKGFFIKSKYDITLQSNQY